MVPVLTTLSEVLSPARCALLAIDVQRDFVHERGWAERHGSSGARLRGVIPVINALIGGARRAGVPVCYITMEHGRDVDAPNYQARYAARGMNEEILCAAGSWGAALDDELDPPHPDDLRIVRHTYDGFAGTPLDGLLRARGVETVVATGVVTNLCVQTTVQHAFSLGYYVVVAEDGTAASDEAVQAATLDNFRRFFGHVAPSAAIVSRWSDAPR